MYNIRYIIVARFSRNFAHSKKRFHRATNYINSICLYNLPWQQYYWQLFHSDHLCNYLHPLPPQSELIQWTSNGKLIRHSRLLYSHANLLQVLKRKKMFQHNTCRWNWLKQTEVTNRVVTRIFKKQCHLSFNVLARFLLKRIFRLLLLLVILQSVFALMFSPTCPKAKFRKKLYSFKQILS